MNRWIVCLICSRSHDGSLSDIYILNLSGSGVVNIWAFLSQAATSLGGSYFWHKAKQESIPVDSIPNAAELVVAGEAESFHAVLTGISFKETLIPDLGVFVFPDSIYLDYRMGPQWRVAEVRALFELLYRLQNLERNALVTLPQECVAEVRERFTAAFSGYCKTAAEQALGADSP